MTTRDSFDGLSLRFDTSKGENDAATLHRSDCKMVVSVKPTGKIKIVREDVANEVADLEEREYRVTRCKCCK